MRPIKFRAWDSRNKRFGYVELHANMVSWPTPEWMGQIVQEAHVRLFDVVAYQQFTGLLDKNGKEIYEGDVVRLKYYVTHLKDNPKGFLSGPGLSGDDPVMVPGDTEEIVRIEQVKIPDFYVETERLRERFDEDPGRCMEVIGNIYENPEIVNP